jgi:hypothetical protein
MAMQKIATTATSVLANSLPEPQLKKRQKAAGEDMGFQHLKSREILEGE